MANAQQAAAGIIAGTFGIQEAEMNLSSVRHGGISLVVSVWQDVTERNMLLADQKRQTEQLVTFAELSRLINQNHDGIEGDDTHEPK